MDANEWLMSAGGPPAISWRNKPVGHSVTGVVTQDCQVRQQTDPESGELMWWDEGRTQPRMHLIVFIKTDLRDPSIEDDDGQRRLFVQGKSLTDGTREAVKRSGAKGIEVGGTITVTYVGEGEQKNRVFNPPKLFKVEYRPPAADAAIFEQPSGSTYVQASAPGPHATAHAAPPSTPPPGLDMSAWKSLPDAAREQILAALGSQRMAAAASSEPPF